ncbi:allophanate hydrolase subunit 1 [Nakamurella sp. DB0629]|uniref:Allophanate hydrolase subunit 1 n=2 Tax=Nakamurella aerolata TaxID=1656892 RepID=A0A849AAD9_9ACTN|nr:allophanate hydrolase subunit 1 [Nakamurella aerolata]NNG35450.1 allophanate hydrolase subunit 1 [Nakamurella aerolata]
MGDRALLLEVDSADQVAALDQLLRQRVSGRASSGSATASEIVEVVPAARTLLVRTRDVPSAALWEALGALVRGGVVGGSVVGGGVVGGGLDAEQPNPAATVLGAGAGSGPGSAAGSGAEADAGRGAGSGAAADLPVEIPVRYDGADLGEVAALTGLGVAELIAAHTDSVWRAAFAGFAPGFAYLTGGDPRLAVPRRTHPRTEIPSGAVGLAGEYCGIYPRRSPGGWQLIGRTDAVLWDERRDPPALLTPGTLVRFVAVRDGR